MLTPGNTTAGGGDSVVVVEEDDVDCCGVVDPVLDVVLDDDVAFVDETEVAVVAVVTIVEVVADVVLVVEPVELLDEDEVEEPSAIALGAVETRSAPPSSAVDATVVVAPGSSATTVTATRSATGSGPDPEHAVGASTATDTARAVPHRRLQPLVRITRRLPRFTNQP